MKKILFLLFIVMSQLTFAQSNKVVAAKMSLESGELDKAKSAIDEAIKHPKTAQKSSSWFVRGDIYYSIFTSTDQRYQELKEGSAKIALESYSKAKTLDRNESSKSKSANRKLGILQNMELNNGVLEFNNKAYDKALGHFKTTANIAEHLGKKDSLAIYNAGLAAEKSTQYDDAINYYKQCMALDFKASSCCSFIIYLYQKLNKDEAASSQIKECRKKYPDDQNLIITELNTYIKAGKYEEAVTNIQSAIQQDPGNHILHFSAGSLLQQLGQNDTAEQYYLTAIKIKSDYFEAAYSLGALYFNMGVEENNLANNEVDFNKANTIQVKADEMFKKSVPYLEKARTIKPDDYNTLSSLMQLYARIGDSEKYKEVKILLGH